MKPKKFVALAAVAAVSLVIAIVTYVSSVPWSSRLTLVAEPLLPSLRMRAGDIVAIEVKQGKETQRLELKDGVWRLASEGGYPAETEKVRELILAATEAEIVERKTAKPERHADLGLSDPMAEGASARLIRFLDSGGSPIGEIIAGRNTVDAFEASKGGTYVRRPGANETWLANRQIAGSLSMRDWAATRLIDVKPETLTSIRIEPEGAEAYDIRRASDGKTHELVEMPAGKKLKYVSGVDDIAEAVSLIEFKGVEKAGKADGVPLKGKATMTMENGFKATLELRSDDKDAWLRIVTSGEGEGKAMSDALKARAEGWDFKVPLAEVKAVIVKKADLLEDAAS